MEENVDAVPEPEPAEPAETPRSLLQRLWSLPQSLGGCCARDAPQAPKSVPAPGPPPPERQEPPKAEPPQTAPAPEPVEPVRMTPAQERARRYMQRADRFLELLARNTHEF